MGMYDTILVPCPKCGERYDAQSKSGECSLQVFSFEECPEDVMRNVNRHAPFVCECGTAFMVEFKPEPIIVRTIEVETNDFPILPEDYGIGDFVNAFIQYQENLDKK